MSESRVPENGMHGLIGGRWGGTTDANRYGRETFGSALDVGVTDFHASGLPHQAPAPI